MEYSIKNLQGIRGSKRAVTQTADHPRPLGLAMIEHALADLAKAENASHPDRDALIDAVIEVGSAISAASESAVLPVAYYELRAARAAPAATPAPRQASVAATQATAPATAPQRAPAAPAAPAAPVATPAPRQPSPAAAEAIRLGNEAVQRTLDAKNCARSMNGKPPLDRLDAALETKIRLDAVAAAGLGRDLDDDPVAAARAFNRHRRN